MEPSAQVKAKKLAKTGPKFFKIQKFKILNKDKQDYNKNKQKITLLIYIPSSWYPIATLFHDHPFVWSEIEGVVGLSSAWGEVCYQKYYDRMR